MTAKIHEWKNSLGSFPISKLVLLIIALIIIVFLLSFLIAFLVKYAQEKAKSEKMVISTLRKGNSPLLIPYANLPIMNRQEYTYSLWIYISEWQSGYPQCIFFRGYLSDTGQIQEASPSLWIYPDTNNLWIRTELTDGATPNYPSNVQSCGGITASNCLQESCLSSNTQQGPDIANIPLQKWVNIGLVMSNRTLDVYLNGKLTRSCLIRGIPKVSNGNLYVTLQGNGFTGYDGYLSRFRIYNHASSASHMYKLYQEGPYSQNIEDLSLSNINLNLPEICPSTSEPVTRTSSS